MGENIALMYKDILEERQYEELPIEWSESINLNAFSPDINLYDYQQEAIESTIRFLFFYYNQLVKYDPNESEDINLERKNELHKILLSKDKRLIESLKIDNKKSIVLFNKIRKYFQFETEGTHEVISFSNFVNRISLWMATGSGKTLV